jgi:hypothetical protein
MGVLRHARVPVPQISDDIGIWLPARAVATLRAHTISRWQIPPYGFCADASGGKRFPGSVPPVCVALRRSLLRTQR